MIASIRDGTLGVDAVRQGSDAAPVVVAQGKPQATPVRPIVRVPAQATPCVGRGREIAQLTELLADPGVRLVTVTGAGGMGKTRLALAVAQQLVDDVSASAGAPQLRSFPTASSSWRWPRSMRRPSWRRRPPRPWPSDPRPRQVAAVQTSSCAITWPASVCCWCWITSSSWLGKGTDEGAGEGAAWLAELLGAAPGSRRWSPHASRWIWRRSNGIRSRGWPCRTWKPSCPTSRWTGRAPSPYLCRWRGGSNTASG